MQQLENDLDQTQEKLMNANQRLEEKEKALQNVSQRLPAPILILSLFSSSLSSDRPLRNCSETQRTNLKHCLETQ